jgi:hypothetical protein
MHIALGLIVGLVTLVFGFAILTRPFRWLAAMWLLFLGVSFITLVISGLCQKIFDAGGGLFERHIDSWALLAFYVTPRALGAVLVTSMAYRGLAHLITRGRAA